VNAGKPSAYVVDSLKARESPGPRRNLFCVISAPRLFATRWFFHKPPSTPPQPHLATTTTTTTDTPSNLHSTAKRRNPNYQGNPPKPNFISQQNRSEARARASFMSASIENLKSFGMSHAYAWTDSGGGGQCSLPYTSPSPAGHMRRRVHTLRPVLEQGAASKRGVG